MAAAAVSLLAIFNPSEPAACGWEPSYSASRYPAFLLTDTPVSYPRDSDVSYETVAFWEEYVGNRVDYSDIRDFFNTATYTSVARRTDRNPFFLYLVKNNKTAAIRFLEKSIQFNEALAARTDESWDYRKPDDSRLGAIAAGITIPAKTSPLFGRYVFLAMRVNSALKRYDEVVSLWNRYSPSIPDGALKERMRGYLGGAYYYQKNYVDAISIFAENGDAASLNWCLSHLVGTDNLEKLFRHDPNSIAVQYVLQDYMNYLWLLRLNRAREFNFAMPGNPYRNSETEDDTDLASECRRFLPLADKAMADPKVSDPMMWATAKAFALNMMGNGDEAKSAIARAAGLKGTQAMKSNMERVRLWIDFSNLNESDTKESASVAERYNALYARAAGEAPVAANRPVDFPPSYIANYTFLADFLVPYAAIIYRNTPRYARALAMMEGIRNMNMGETYSYFNPEKLPTASLPASAIAALLEMAADPAKLSPLDKAILSGAHLNMNPIYDSMGRIELSRGNYAKALDYFEKIDPFWISRQSYYPYLQIRYNAPSVPFKRRDSRDLDADSISNPESHNYRADLCRKLIYLKKTFQSTAGEAKAIAGYNYAAALFQASAQGDLWALSDNCWSTTTPSDSLSRLADRILAESVTYAENPTLKGQILFAKAGIRAPKPDDNYLPQPFYLTSEGHYQWNRPTKSQMEAYAELARLYPSIKDPQIKGCDVLKAYIDNAILPGARD